MKTIKLKIECKSCGGTGLYVGMAERDGAAVICSTCEGTGCQDYVFSYEPFVERKKRDDVKRVFKTSCGYVHTVKDRRNPLGDFIEYSKGGVSYKDWLNGGIPKPIKNLYCPLQFTGQQWKSSQCDLMCGSLITKCRHRGNMDKCWDEFEKSNYETIS